VPRDPRLAGEDNDPFLRLVAIYGRSGHVDAELRPQLSDVGQRPGRPPAPFLASRLDAVKHHFA
jgi:hypothetical protein